MSPAGCWLYDAHRGWLTNKVYADGKGTHYGYTDAGRLSFRVWARGTNTTYAYNPYGDLACQFAGKSSQGFAGENQPPLR